VRFPFRSRSASEWSLILFNNTPRGTCPFTFLFLGPLFSSCAHHFPLEDIRMAPLIGVPPCPPSHFHIPPLLLLPPTPMAQRFVPQACAGPTSLFSKAPALPPWVPKTPNSQTRFIQPCNPPCLEHYPGPLTFPHFSGPPSVPLLHCPHFLFTPD